MEKNQMKNIVVLKNLPSNLIEEALVIFKSNSIAKSFQYIENKENKNYEKEKKDDYVIREAEMIISNYINTTEENKDRNNNKKTIKKNKFLKIYSAIVTILLFILIAIK